MNLEPKKKTVTFIEEEPLENHEGDKITTIVKEKSNNNPTSIIKTEKKNENKIDEEPVEQKELLKHITRKEIRFSHELHKTLVTIPRKVLNRRYKKLQEIIDGDSDYFDEDQIRKREPVIYFLYVGRYIRENSDAKQNMADILTEQIQINEWKDDLKVQLKKEGFTADIDFDEEIEIKPDELEDNIDEMMRFLHDKFVAGLDKHADYDQIDNDESLDDLKIINQDKEEEYFGKEDEEIEEKNETEYTGIQDY